MPLWKLIVPVILSLMSTVAHAAPISGQGTWETTLQGRDLDGNPATFEAYYDTVADITWLADANYAGTTMDWATANAWAAGLNINGITGWRLPNTAPISGSFYSNSLSYDGTTDVAYNISAPGTLFAGYPGSELAHMYYNTLGNLAYYDTFGNGPQPGWGLTNTGPFSNLQASSYWSATDDTPYPGYAWFFNTSLGSQTNNGFKGSSLYAWAVHSGDVGTPVVPIPPAAWLFGSGLMGLVGVAMKRRG